jgi:energy-coupling factor transport system ATP-binding protein
MTAPLDNLIETGCVDFSYGACCGSGRDRKALDGVSLRIGKGEHVAIAGGNGSGKTTFARLLNALLLPTGGTVCIGGTDTSDKERLWEIRRIVGMVFQDPDSQIVGTTVAEDVAFGPANLGLEPEEMRRRVRRALRDVGMGDFAGAAPHLLSGGLKQKVSMAGVLAMKPACVILDEATAKLDPIARKEIMDVLRLRNREEGVTVLHITHDMEEAALADRVIVLDAGKVVLDGSPREVFSQATRLRSLGMDVPQVTELFDLLREEGMDLPFGVLDVEEAAAILTRSITGRGYAFHTS